MKRVLVLAVFVIGAADRIGWGVPTIHVEWDETQPLIPGTDYVIDTTVNGTTQFPNVELKAGSLTWRVWSEDSGNPEGIGDIGIVSSPTEADFGVKFARPDASPGARNVKGIQLAPPNSNNYGNITGGQINGGIEGDVVVQVATTGGSAGTGGEINSILIGGTLGGQVTIDKIPADAVVELGTVAGQMTIGEIRGSLTVSTISGTVEINTAIGGAALITIVNALTGVLTLDSVQDELILNYNGISAGGLLTIGEIEGSTVLLGSTAGDELAGTVTFASGIGNNSTIQVQAVLSGTIDLNDAGISDTGFLYLYGGGDGDIVNGGTLGGTLRSGTALLIGSLRAQPPLIMLKWMQMFICGAPALSSSQICSAGTSVARSTARPCP